jgi:hypothetical protein
MEFRWLIDVNLQYKPWLKTYIDVNTQKRKMVNNEFEKDVFKLMNNAVFGKTIENLRKRLIVQLVNNQSKARKLTSKPTFHAFRIFNEDLVAVHMLKQRLYLNRPIYVGFTILDVILIYIFGGDVVAQTISVGEQQLKTLSILFLNVVVVKVVHEGLRHI